MKPTPDTISKCIRDAIAKAMTNGLVRPTALYLGEEEYAALNSYAMERWSVTKSPEEHADVIEFDGMTIHRVMEPSHLGVA